MTIVRNMGRVLSHPLDFFYDIQFQNRSKWHHAAILLALVLLVKLLGYTLVSFHYKRYLSMFFETFAAELLYVAGPWATWCIANWAVSTILEGEGKFKDIVVCSSYALTPFILFSLPLIALTNLLTLDESGLYQLLRWTMLLWCALLYVLHVKVLHDFEPGKTIWTVVLTVAGAAVLWFIAILMVGLVNQAVLFVAGIIKEIRFRM